MSNRSYAAGEFETPGSDYTSPQAVKHREESAACKQPGCERHVLVGHSPFRVPQVAAMI